MTQTFQTFNEGPGGDSVKTGLLYQRTRTDSLRSQFSGTTFPSSPVLGQPCYRTDQTQLYVCTDATTPVWTPLAMGNPLGVAQGGTGSTSASGARTNLGLGTAAVLNTGTGSGDIPTITLADARYFKISDNLSTGTAATMRSNLGLGSAALAQTNLGFTSAVTTTISDIRLIPQLSKSVAYTLALADNGFHILHPSADTTARTWTVPANSSVAFPIGTCITLVNQNGAGDITVAITTDTMRQAGSGLTGSRTLAANGMATLLKLTSTEWIISGVGLT